MGVRPYGCSSILLYDRLSLELYITQICSFNWRIYLGHDFRMTVLILLNWFILWICPACVPNILPTVIQMFDIYSTHVNNQLFTGIRAHRGQLVDCRQ